MTPQSAATMLLADALERGLPAHDGLGSLDVSSQVKSAATSGDLNAALVALNVDPTLRVLARAWPRALAPALRRFEALPQQATFTFHVLQTAVYVFFVAVLQVVIGSVVTHKVHPVLAKMGADFGLVSHVHLATTFATLFMVAMVPLVVWLFAGASGWARLPGWGRELQRAKEAAVAAALLESDPPDDVRLAFYSKLQWLGDTTLAPVDLSLLAERATVEAERALAKYLALTRVVALGLLTLNAFGLLVSVYVTLANLAGVS